MPTNDTAGTALPTRPLGPVPIMEALRQHWRGSVIVFVVTLVAFAAIGMAMPTNYTAAAVIQVTPVAGSQAGGTVALAPVNVATEARAVTSSLVADRASQALDGALSSNALMASTTAEAPSGTQVISVTVKAANANLAAKAANEMARAYLELRKADADATVTTADERLAKLADQYASVKSTSAKTPDIAWQRAQLQQINRNPGKLVTEATAERASTSRALVLAAGGGALTGVVLAVLFALLRERGDRRVRSAERLARLAGREVFAWNGDAESSRRLAQLIMPIADRIVVAGDDHRSADLAEGLAQAIAATGRPVNIKPVGGSDATDIDTGGWTPVEGFDVDGQVGVIQVQRVLGASRVLGVARRPGARTIIIAQGAQNEADVMDLVAFFDEAHHDFTLVFAGQPVRGKQVKA